MADVFADPQVRHRKLRIDLPMPLAEGGSVPGLASPIVLDGERMVSTRPAPALGEATDLLDERRLTLVATKHDEAGAKNPVQVNTLKT